MRRAMFRNSAKSATLISEALKATRPGFLTAAFFSLFINVLAFVSPLYMLQIYDRVITSRNVTTLIALTVIAVFLVVIYALLEKIRSAILVRVGILFSDLSRARLFDAVLKGTLLQPGRGHARRFGTPKCSTRWECLRAVTGCLVVMSSAVGAGRAPDAKSSNTSAASTTEPLFALELDQLFRSDRKPTDPGDPELRAQAARIISSGLGHHAMAPDDRAYLVRLVETRTGLAATDADNRVTQIVNKSHDAVAKARRSAVILAFMVGASLLLGAAVAWLAAAAGGQHRDGGIALDFWRRWEVDRTFMIR